MKKKITAVLMAALMLTGSVSGVYAAEPGKTQKQNQQVINKTPAEEETINKETNTVNDKIPETEVKAPETETDIPETQPEVPEEKIEVPETKHEEPETETEAPEIEIKTPETQPELPFKDVDENDWYYEAVSEMYTKGLIDWNAEGKFRPEEDIAGIELLTMLYRADGNKNDTKENVISWAKKNKILLEDDGWEFESDKSLKREQVMVIVYRYLLYKGINMTNNGELSYFSDKDKVSSYAKDAISSLVNKGIISKSSGTVRPDEALTKAEAASIISSVLKLIG